MLKDKDRLDMGRMGTKPAQGNWMAKKSDPPTRQKNNASVRTDIWKPFLASKKTYLFGAGGS